MKIPDENVRNDNLHQLEILNRNYQTALALLPLPQYKNYANAIFAGDCYRWMNQPAKSRTSYDAARTELEKLLKDNPQDEYLHSWISQAYAGLNRKEEAIREAKTALELLPVSKDAIAGPSLVGVLAIVYVMVGEYESALDQIEYLLTIPTHGYATPSVPMLRIDPRWDPLRSHPRFHKILEKYSYTQAR
jgi:tetratricopeptide (TPR) repeat protein